MAQTIFVGQQIFVAQPIIGAQATIVGAQTLAGVTTSMGADLIDQQATTSRGITNSGPTSSSVPGVTTTTDRTTINICSLNVYGLDNKTKITSYLVSTDYMCILKII